MKCMVCGHIYDPVKGDVGADAGTDFEALPAEWHCPVCGTKKQNFKEL
ncbi:rubredoxin [Methanochimaera problematica]|nr:rubredoxin [Methanoplanus sp. FWC-SCC4]